MEKNHKPDPEFVERLEWQLASELRRQQRNVSKTRLPSSWLRTAALILVSIGLGVAGTQAAEHFQYSWERDLWVARVTTGVEVAEAKAQAVQAWVREEQKRFEAGLTGHENLLMAREELRQAEAEVELARLDLEEVQSSGAAPNLDLFAPLVFGRDFVSERHQIQIERHEGRRQMLSDYFKTLEDQVDAGLSDTIELQMMDRELRAIENRVDYLKSQLQSRSAFLRGEITAAQLELADKLRGAEQDLKAQRLELAAAEQQMQEIQERSDAGLASAFELKGAAYQLKVAQAQERLASTVLEILRTHSGSN